MGSDIFSESAVAVRLEDFFDKPAVKKKSVREAIAKDLHEVESVDDTQLKEMSKNKGEFISTLLSVIEEELCDESGYGLCEEANSFVIETFCEHTGVDLRGLPDFSVRAFRNCRESGYEVEIGVPYIMFDPNGLFVTKLSEDGDKVAEILGLDDLTETTWTVHSY